MHPIYTKSLALALEVSLSSIYELNNCFEIQNSY